jgi:cohesin complex subunit SA-1/2
LAASSLKTTNSIKLADFDELLMAALRDITADKDISTVTFEEPEITGLESSLLRIKTVLMSRDISQLLEDDADGKQSKAWDIIMALAERGRLGIQEEAKVRWSLRCM